MKHVLYALAALLTFAACGPTARFTYAPEQDRTAPSRIKFDNESEKAETYRWDFGDGNTSTEENPTHRYGMSGNYDVSLTAIDGKKEKTTTKTLQIISPLKCLVEIETKFGTMVVELSDATPKHRDNFIKLAEDGFYDGLLFHRVIEGFMVQGGDPVSKNATERTPLGSGGPGYQVDAEFVDSLVHLKGAIAAARTGDRVNPERKSSGSQFYIVQGRPVTEAMLDQFEAQKGIRYTPEQRAAYLENGGTPFLDRDYVVFGRVVEGLDVVDQIARQKTRPGDRPVDDVKMEVRVIK